MSRDEVAAGSTLSSTSVSGPGRVHATGADLEFGTGAPAGGLFACGNAVFATGGITRWSEEGGGLLVESTSLRGSPDADVLLDGASATFSGSTWSGNAIYAAWQGCDATLEPGSGTSGLTTEACPTWERLVVEVSCSPSVDEPVPVE